MTMSSFGTYMQQDISAQPSSNLNTNFPSSNKLSILRRITSQDFEALLGLFKGDENEIIDAIETNCITVSEAGSITHLNLLKYLGENEKFDLSFLEKLQDLEECKLPVAPKTIGITVKVTDFKMQDTIRKLVQQVQAWCKEREITLQFDQYGADFLGLDRKAEEKNIRQVKDVVKASDVMIALGGDGTLLRALRHARDNGPFFLGVNFGTLGFLTPIPPDDLMKHLDDLYNLKAKYEKRPLFHFTITREGEKTFSSFFFNEVLIKARNFNETIPLTIKLGDTEYISIPNCDGAMFSTPSGSTAYNFSAHGPVVDHACDAIIITLINPHLGRTVPSIYKSNCHPNCTIPSTRQVAVAYDGDEVPVQSGDKIEVDDLKRYVFLVLPYNEATLFVKISAIGGQNKP